MTTAHYETNLYLGEMGYLGKLSWSVVKPVDHGILRSRSVAQISKRSGDPRARGPKPGRDPGAPWPRCRDLRFCPPESAQSVKSADRCLRPQPLRRHAEARNCETSKIPTRRGT